MSNLIVKFNSIPDVLILPDVIEVVVDTNVFLPAMFTILIHDEIDIITGKLKHADDPLKFGLGTKVEIIVDADDDSLLPPINTIVEGEITSVEPVFREDGQVYLKLRGYDPSHRMTHGKVTRTFGDGNPIANTVTDFQIVSTIASKYGLIPKIQNTSARYNYVMQYNQSDWDFLWSRAEQAGYQLYVDGKFLHFVESSKTRYLRGPSDLTWGRNLSKFEPRMSLSGTVTRVEAYGWDPKSKKKISVSQATARNRYVKTTEATVGSGLVHRMKFRITPETTIVDTTLRDRTQAKQVVEAEMETHESQFVRASGVVPFGDPFLLAGTKVTIKNVGIRFSGSYYVTEAKHIWRNGTYQTHFQVSGRNPYTFRSLLNGSEEHNGSKIDGVVVGIVTNLNDPESLGRIKVKFPWMPEFKSAEMESSWARVATIGGGKDRGIIFLPEVNDEVLVSFEGGDISLPYIVGVLWNNRDRPPKEQILDPAKKLVNQRIIRSRSGHVVVLDDTKGQEKITITDKTNKNFIEIDSVKNSMLFKTAGDFTIDAGGKFTVKSKLDLLMDSKAKATMNAVGNMVFDSKAGAQMKAMTAMLDLKPAAAALKGTKVDIQGTADTSISSAAKTSVKGGAMVEIQGAIVKIN
jgi:uncharacterized protein involved in type VI secretion and phage assembly